MYSDPAPGRTANELAGDAGARVATAGLRIGPSGNDVQRRYLRRTTGNTGRLPDDRGPRRPPAIPRLGRRPRRLGQPAVPTHGPRSGDVAHAPDPRPVQRWRSWRVGAARRWPRLIAVAAVGTLPDRAATGRPDGPRVDRTRGRPRVGRRCCATAASPLWSPTTSTMWKTPHAPDTLLLVAADPARRPMTSLLQRLADSPGDLLLVEPTSHARAALAPGIRITAQDAGRRAGLRAARSQSGRIGATSGPADTYEAAGDSTLTSCYGGALVRYRDGERTITVVGSTDFMTNGGLLRGGQCRAGDEPRRPASPPVLVRTAAHRR